MKIGDKVNVVDEAGVFIIKVINENNVIILDEFGFENTYPIQKLIPYVSIDDFNIDFKEVIKHEDYIKKNKVKTDNKDEIREVDLHIGHLVDSLRNLQPHQMLQKQVNIARIEIEKAKSNKIKKLILIHGKGKGVLKTEIYKLLETVKGIEYFEADIVKYRFGAVEIRFK